jgi:peptidoglycan/xylan/chitin deacetylase (PgdA/CDA1 family)
MLGAMVRIEICDVDWLYLMIPFITFIDACNQIFQKIKNTQDILKKITKRTPTLFRTPYNEYGQRVLQIAISLGLQPFGFDLI